MKTSSVQNHPSKSEFWGSIRVGKKSTEFTTLNLRAIENLITDSRIFTQSIFDKLVTDARQLASDVIDADRQQRPPLRRPLQSHNLTGK